MEIKHDLVKPKILDIGAPKLQVILKPQTQLTEKWGQSIWKLKKKCNEVGKLVRS
jgi:hypothetical protein